jgi:hypothetical protein
MPRFFKVPEDRKHETGMFIGGGFVSFKDGIAEQPDGVDWSWALPGFTEVAGPQVPGAPEPEALPAAEAAPKD